MSSHREAPETSKDPAADNTDVYAFVSPDSPNTVTIIANYIPFQLADGGPNFNEFSEDVSYRIHVSNAGDARDDIVYEFTFTTNVRNGNTFLYNTGPITSLTSSAWNRFQTYTVKKFTRTDTTVGTTLATGLMTPPCNVGERSTPNYEALATAAIHSLDGGIKVFAGQRAEGFFVDLGAIFDLGTLRPFEDHHLIPSAAAAQGVNATQQLNVHSIAMQIPKTFLTRDGSAPTDVMSPLSVIGVYASASRQVASVFSSKTGKRSNTGPLVQVSRLGNPLINEVINGMGQKDGWNTAPPSNDSAFVANYNRPGLSALLPVLYPGVFPHLATLDSTDRSDIVAILLTGLPAGIVPGFQNYTGPVQADLLRLNMAVTPTTTNPSPDGILGGDLAGFPNGRRVFDDVVAIELRALAGATYPLVMPSYTPDAAAGALKDGTTNTNQPYKTSFPYLGTPNSGSKVKPGKAAA
jgi:hypothetical protein